MQLTNIISDIKNSSYSKLLLFFVGMNITEIKSVININQCCFNIDFLTLSEFKSDIKLLIFPLFCFVYN